MFHVEHSPIQKLAPLKGAPLQQIKALRVYQLQREQRGKLSGCLDAFPIKAGCELTASGTLYT